MSAAVQSSPRILTVLREGRCCGFVLSRGPKGFESFDSDDTSLGTFGTKEEAAAIVLNLSAAPAEGD
jgi:hypothetical protein